VRARLVGERTGIINQIRAFLLERGIAVRQGLDRAVVAHLSDSESRDRRPVRLPRCTLASLDPLAGAGPRSLPSGSSFWMVRASRMTSRQDKSST
jgi:hypothetical protein